MVNIPRALFPGRTGREPRYHVAIEELQDWAYTGKRLVTLKGYPDLVWERPKSRKRPRDVDHSDLLDSPGGSALDGRTLRHPGYAVSQWICKQVEEAFGWIKTVGGLRRTRYRGRARVQMHAYLVAAAYNLVRIANLSPLLGAVSEHGCC
jgi:hypothetical protein